MALGRPVLSHRWQCSLAGGAVGAANLAAVSLIGWFGGVVLTFVIVLPTTIISGLLASYLWDGSVLDGAVVGALAGAIAVLPGALLPLWLFVGVFTVSEGTGMVLAYSVMSAILFMIGLIAATALGALGGVAWAVHSNGRRHPDGVAEPDESDSAPRKKTGGRDGEPAESVDRRGPVRDRTDAGESESPEGATHTDRFGGTDDGSAERSTADEGASRWFAGTVGGLVGMVLLPIGIASPLSLAGAVVSPVVAGGAAGYLRDGDARDGAVVGALAGAVTFSPVALLLIQSLGDASDSPLVVLVLGAPFVAINAVGGVLGATLSKR